MPSSSLTLHMVVARSSDAILALLYSTQFQTDTKMYKLRITTSTGKRKLITPTRECRTILRDTQSYGLLTSKRPNDQPTVALYEGSTRLRISSQCYLHFLKSSSSFPLCRIPHIPRLCHLFPSIFRTTKSFLPLRTAEKHFQDSFVCTATDLRQLLSWDIQNRYI